MKVAGVTGDGDTGNDVSVGGEVEVNVGDLVSVTTANTPSTLVGDNVVLAGAGVALGTGVMGTAVALGGIGVGDFVGKSVDVGLRLRVAVAISVAVAVLLGAAVG